ncbi:hypothetical protein [Microcoleus sp. CAWBG640]|uniref:hypothetical protein n=1 Tax=Microcoleus sp. CAWBG640 TaxID=2841653 RepID=UPI00312B8309
MLRCRQILQTKRYPFSYEWTKEGEVVFFYTGEPIVSPLSYASGMDSVDISNVVLSNIDSDVQTGGHSYLSAKLTKLEFISSRRTRSYGVDETYYKSPSQSRFTVGFRFHSIDFDPDLSTLTPPIILPDSGSPPPPPPRKMCGCDCNMIATIVSERVNELTAQKQKQFDAIRDHIDVRAIEQLQQINKMLQGVEIDADLQPIIDEIKRAEANLWNGINGG